MPYILVKGISFSKILLSFIKKNTTQVLFELYFSSSVFNFFDTRIRKVRNYASMGIKLLSVVCQTAEVSFCAERPVGVAGTVSRTLARSTECPFTHWVDGEFLLTIGTRCH